MLVLAYTTMMRRGELVLLEHSDLTVESDGFGTVLIRRGKTDQEGVGAIVPIPADAMRHVQVWVDAAGIHDGPLFRAVLKGGRIGGALVPGDVSRAFKLMADPARVSESGKAVNTRANFVATLKAVAASEPLSAVHRDTILLALERASGAEVSLVPVVLAKMRARQDGGGL